MAKPFDPSKFRKTLTKSIEGMSIGFNDPTVWVSTGSYALNYLISSDFNKGIPLGKVTVFSGESGAGKSFLASGNIIKNAQDMGIYVVVIDTENALDEAWLHALGVQTSEDKLLKLSMSMIDDIAKTISEFVKEYKELPGDDRPQVLFVIDSLGMAMTPTEVDQFDAGSLRGDFGRKPKALKALVTNCVNMFGNLNIGLVATNHSYSSQDPYNPDPVVSGGCLTAGHMVRMADGTIKCIQNITVNDVVQTLEGDYDVTETYHYTDKEVFELVLSTGEVIQATGAHKFMVQDSEGSVSWKTVDELSENDEIIQTTEK